MARLPDEMNQAKGAVYVLTHAREFDREQWTQATISCLTGEHGPEARALVHKIALKLGITIGPES